MRQNDERAEKHPVTSALIRSEPDSRTLLLNASRKLHDFERLTGCGFQEAVIGVRKLSLTPTNARQTAIGSE
jgi:hypothetical protein